MGTCNGETENRNPGNCNLEATKMQSKEMVFLSENKNSSSNYPNKKTTAAETSSIKAIELKEKAKGKGDFGSPRKLPASKVPSSPSKYANTPSRYMNSNSNSSNGQLTPTPREKIEQAKQQREMQEQQLILSSAEKLGRKVSRTQAQQIGTRLYENSVKTQEKLEAKRLEMGSQLTFQPRLLTARYEKAQKNENELNDQSARFEKLYLDHKTIEEHRERAKKEALMVEAALVTGKPTINNATPTNSSKKEEKKAGEEDEAGDRFSTLYNDAKRRQQEKKEASCGEKLFTFSPDLSKTTYYTANATAMSASSEGAKCKTKTAKDVVQRLLNSKSKVAERLEARYKEMKEAERSECTFQPTMKRHASAPKLRERKEGISFYDRSRDYEAKRQEKATRLSQQMEEANKATETFKPKLADRKKTVNPNTVDNADTKAVEDVSEKSVPVFQRLLSQSSKNAARAEEKLAQLKKEEEKELTFRPSLPKRPASAPRQRRGNEPSNEMNKRINNDSELTTTKAVSSIFDRLNQEKKKMDERLKIQQEEKKKIELEGCTFKPQVSGRRSSVGESSENGSGLVINENGNIHERLYKEHDSRGKQLKQQQDEYLKKESESLTFAPKVQSFINTAKITKKDEEGDDNKEHSCAKPHLPAKGNSNTKSTTDLSREALNRQQKELIDRAKKNRKSLDRGINRTTPKKALVIKTPKESTSAIEDTASKPVAKEKLDVSNKETETETQVTE